MHLNNLTQDQWQRVEAAADRLALAWGRGEPKLDDHLPAPSDSLRKPILTELIIVDLEQRWLRKKGRRLEDYLAAYPELGTAATLPANLIYEEYRARQLHGDRPPVATYRERFPKQFLELAKLVEEAVVNPLSPVRPHELPPNATESAVQLHWNNLVPVQGYKVLNHLGSGGFGQVWKAEAPGGVEVAVKIIFRTKDDRDAQRELEALELIKRLRHPFLLRTQAYWALEDRIVIVTDLADGNLRDRLREHRKQGAVGIPLPELLTYFREAAEALDFLHEKQLQHRDVKPDNVLCQGKHALLADFGMARVFSGRRLSTVTGAGTPPYMSPENWSDKVSAHSDQYSLAASYVEMRLGRRLFASRELRDLMLDHLQNEPNLSPLPLPEERVLRKALAKVPEARFPNCTAFLDSLTAAVERGTLLPEQPAAPVQVEPATPRRKPWVFAAVGLFFVLLVGIVVWWARS